jgi:hypothetical protein
MKFGLINLSVKKLEKIKESIYISLVIKPRIPNAKWRMEVGKS